MGWTTPLDIARDNPTPAEWHQAVTSGRSLSYNGLPVVRPDTAHFMGCLVFGRDYPEWARLYSSIFSPRPT